MKNFKILGGPFKGASLLLDWPSSKRKILGIYEHNLNAWIKQKLPEVQVVIDVGSNDGYFTYGSAHALKHYNGKGSVMVFEPGLPNLPQLQQPATWPHYADIDFEFFPKFVGSQVNDKTTTLDVVWQQHPTLHGQTALVKVDVEGAELEVLAGSSMLLQPPHQWVVEVHGDQLLEPVLKYFHQANRKVEIITDHPHWLLGSEARTLKTSWVVTTD